MSKIAFRGSFFEDFSRELPDDWVGRPIISLPRLAEIEIATNSSDQPDRTKHDFEFIGYEEYYSKTLPLYKLIEPKDPHDSH